MRRKFPGPVAAVGGFEVGIGDEVKTVIDEDGNITSHGSLTVDDGFVGDLIGNVTGDVAGNVTGNLTGNVLGDVVGNVTGILDGYVDGYVVGGLYGDFISAIATETAAQLAAAFEIEEGTWRLFLTSDGELAVLTTAGVKLVTLADPE